MAFEDCKEQIKAALTVPPPSTQLEEYVLVTNLPTVPPEKKDKFIEVFINVASKLSLTITPAMVTMPFNEDGKMSCGCLFVRAADVRDADSMATKLTNVKIGKANIKAIIMSDFDKLLNPKPVEERALSKARY